MKIFTKGILNDFPSNFSVSVYWKGSSGDKNCLVYYQGKMLKCKKMYLIYLLFKSDKYLSFGGVPKTELRGHLKYTESALCEII